MKGLDIEGFSSGESLSYWRKNYKKYILASWLAIPPPCSEAHPTTPMGILVSQDLEFVKGTSLAVQWLGLCLPMKGMQVQFLVRELRFHMSCGKKKTHKHKTEANKQTKSNKFNKAFENGPHQKKKKNLFNKKRIYENKR